MLHNVKALHDVKQAIRQPYAWPGGYAKTVLMGDGASLHVSCARKNWAEICKSTLGAYGNDWEVVAVYVNWEDSSLYCAECGMQIEPEYA